MIIDLDSHLRESYLLDEVYNLSAPFAEFTPMCISEGEPSVILRRNDEGTIKLLRGSLEAL